MHFEHIFTNTLNRFAKLFEKRLTGGVPLGHLVVDEKITKQLYLLPTMTRTRHVAIQGKTGSGKSFLIRHLAQHDIEVGHGFLLFDLHGDLIYPLLCYLAERQVDPSKVIVVDPASREYSVGLNPLQCADDTARFLQVAEMTRMLADRWEFKGARTEELSRNTLFVLSANNLTLLEVPLLLSNDSYRQQLLQNVSNQEVREYFELRFDPLSEAMKATVREPLLNKLSEFTADPHFRSILGQQESTLDFDRVLDEGTIVLVNLNKGRLGIHALTFGGLVLGALKAAIFRRKKRSLYSIYADEMQNLLSADTDFDVLFAEARKFGIGIVTANQFSAQLPPKMRSAVQAIGTRIFFQSSSEDAQQAAQEIDGGKLAAERLRYLPSRHFLIKSGNYRTREVRTPDVMTARTAPWKLVDASNDLYARSRVAINAEILSRRPNPTSLEEVIDGWE